MYRYSNIVDSYCLTNIVDSYSKCIYSYTFTSSNLTLQQGYWKKLDSIFCVTRKLLYVYTLLLAITAFPMQSSFQACRRKLHADQVCVVYIGAKQLPPAFV